MKTSTKLLIGLFLGLVVAMFGAGVSLRRQYDRIDKTDNYARWKKTALPAFRAIRISGPAKGTVHIEAGTTPRLLVDTLDSDWQQLKDRFSARVQHDTLLLVFRPGTDSPPNTDYEGSHYPDIRVQCPLLTSLTTSNANAQLANFKGDLLTVNQSGSQGSLTLTNMRLQTLTAAVSGNNQLTIAPALGRNEVSTARGENQIERAAIILRDNAQLIQQSDFSKSFTLDAAPGTTAQLTGKALQQIQR